MTIDEVKELLKSLTMAKRLVEVRQRQLEQCKEFTEVLKAVDYSKIRIQSSENISTVEIAAIRLETCTEKYVTACENMLAIEDKVEKCITTLNEDDKALVVDRFINDTPILQISRKRHFTVPSLHNKYLKIYKKVANNTPKQ